MPVYRFTYKHRGKKDIINVDDCDLFEALATFYREGDQEYSVSGLPVFILNIEETGFENLDEMRSARACGCEECDKVASAACLRPLRLERVARVKA